MVRLLRLTLSAAAILVAGTAYAGDVKITGIHNCCGNCNRIITAALEGAGATTISVKPGEVTFASTDPDKAVKALYDIGYSGKVEGAKVPEAVGAKGVRGKEIKVEGIHNCCPRCCAAIIAALKPIGTSNVKPQLTAFTVTTESEVEASAVVKALRDAGFNVKIVK
jgi:copper chaperone CopZ